MKKFFTLFAVLCLFSVCTLQAQENEYEFFSLTICPGISTAPDSVDVYGLRIGVPVAFGSDSFVAGVEASILAGMSSGIYGIQTAPFYVSADHVSGLQFSIVNIAKTVYGLQLGVVNVAEDVAFQIGLINYIENSPLTVFPIINVKF